MFLKALCRSEGRWLLAIGVVKGLKDLRLSLEVIASAMVELEG